MAGIGPTAADCAWSLSNSVHLHGCFVALIQNDLDIRSCRFVHFNLVLERAAAFLCLRNNLVKLILTHAVPQANAQLQIVQLMQTKLMRAFASRFGIGDLESLLEQINFVLAASISINLILPENNQQSLLPIFLK